MVLTERQRRVIDFIAGFLRSNGYSPSFQEIADGVGLNSIATVHKHILTLERKGFLKRGRNQSRSLEPTSRYLQDARRQRGGRAAWELPLLGRVAAGQPVEALEQPETLSLADFAGQKDVFVLQVKGDSMIEEHIIDGDYILVERTNRASQGDIVVALLGGTETTLKRYHREPDGRIRLQPANARMKPIYVAPDQLAIQGRLIAVLRRY
ncbi:MAG TPA: transcriptional repressor LexA [Terriglobia bacterium]|nr:transcriptional repressor LexA [Terriglobia bacterium]